MLYGFISYYSVPLHDILVSIPYWTALKAEKNKTKRGRSTALAIFPKDCCNGLILCVYKNYTRDESDYVVYNPATQRWIILPKIDRVNPVSTVRFSFDPALL
uniref:Uncharacterized protein n=1 Tax=Oryza nivara TaxID=4536 RepID=A0A0E0IBW8_ORYNI